jgi:glutaminase
VDGNGNSVRAIEACRRIAEAFGLHLFRTHPAPRGAIRHVLDGRQVRSKRTRSLAELDILARHGASICVIEAQDALYFGSVERILRKAGELAGEADFVILDLRRVTAADAAALRLLARFRDTMANAGETILFAHVTEHGPLADLHARLEDDSLYPTRDLALEACEDRLIARHLGDHAPPALSFEAFELFRGLDADQIALLKDIAEPLIADRGDLIAREGETADRFFVLERGSASIRQRLADGGTLRLTAIGPGVGFGERALLDGGPRTADVVADESVLVHAFPVESVRALGAEQPAILVTLLQNMAGELAERLQVANAELRAMQG